MRAAAPSPSGGPEAEAQAKTGWIRPKGNLGPLALWTVAILMVLPLISVLIRSLAAPVVSIPGLEGVQHLGRTLDKIFSLYDLPPQQQGTALRLLLLPLSALLVATARLTFGIRLLGFRSILIAVGFNQSGVVGSLILIAVTLATIVLVRPVLRSIHLPYFGRVPVIICIVACTMVSAMLLSPWVNSRAVAGVAYFPVIVLAMLAEGFANTLDRDNAVAASWRVLTTVTLAFLIAMVSWIPALGALMLEYPELVVPEIVSIVLISEYLDLRLLSSWDARLARMFGGERSARSSRFRVVVVREAALSLAESAAREHHPVQKPRSVTRVVRALRRAGFSSLALEAGSKLPRQLKAALAPTRPGGDPRGLVLYGSLAGPGESGAVVTTAMIERAGIASIGPGPSGHALAADLFAVRTVLRQSGVHVPDFVCVSDHHDPAVESLRFPVSVRPRMKPNIRPKIVSDRTELRSAVRRIVRSNQDALLEEQVKGRRMSACLIGNDSVTCLPLVAINPRDRTKVCPALLDEVAAERVREYALLAFHALGCRDFARVEVSVSESGKVWVLEVRSQGLLASRGAFAVAAAADGREYHQLLREIIDAARARLAPAEQPRRKKAQPRSDTQSATPASV